MNERLSAWAEARDWKTAIPYLILFIALVLLFAYLPVDFAYDWSLFRLATQRLFTGQEIYVMSYENGITSAVFAPPWILIPLGPIAFFSQKFSWALINSFSILSLIFFCRYHKIDKWTTGLLVFSPAMFYNTVHGNLDAFLLWLTLVPPILAPLAAISKPQALAGVAFKLLHEKPIVWLKAAGVSAVVLLISFALFGLWPLRIIELANEQFSGALPHSPLTPIWPLQILLFIGLIAVGYERKDSRFYYAASPFISRYASSGSYLVVLVMLAAGLKRWQSCLIILSWWAVTIYNIITATA
jgi:hypothetical protein